MAEELVNVMRLALKPQERRGASLAKFKSLSGISSCIKWYSEKTIVSNLAG